MNEVVQTRTVKTADNVYTLEIRKYERLCYDKKEERGKGHKYAWLLYICGENVVPHEPRPVFRLRFKTHKAVVKYEKIIRSMLQQGISFNDVWNWSFPIGCEWFWKMTLNKDYVDEEYIPCATPSRWEIIDSKWYLTRNDKVNLNEMLYRVASEGHDYGDKEYNEYSVCIDVMALMELGADIHYCNENGESVYDALVRQKNRFVDFNVLSKVKR